MPHTLHRLSPLLIVLVACSSGPPEDSVPTADLSPPVPTTLTLTAPVHHLDSLAREPMLVEHPSGALFVSGYGSQVRGVNPKAPPNLWRSDDDGATWQRVDIGTAEDGATGNSDVDLAVGPDGTLYFVSMGFDRTAMEGTHIAIGVSHDIGTNWSWTLLSEDRFDDRPWVGVAPDGSAHVIWNDGSGVSYTVSTDNGETWVERDKVHPRGGSSHLAVGPGELAATWFSGSGDTMAVEVALIRTPESEDSQPQILRAKPIQPDTWLEREDQRTRDPGGEYVPVVFLSDGGLAVATPVQDAQGGRFGFSWWKVEAPPDSGT